MMSAPACPHTRNHAAVPIDAASYVPIETLNAVEIQSSEKRRKRRQCMGSIALSKTIDNAILVR